MKKPYLLSWVRGLPVGLEKVLKTLNKHPAVVLQKMAKWRTLKKPSDTQNTPCSLWQWPSEVVKPLPAGLRGVNGETGGFLKKIVKSSHKIWHESDWYLF